jgi:hypothetical protein
MGPVTRRDRLDSFKQEKAISMLLRYPGVALSLLLFNAYLLVVPASMGSCSSPFCSCFTAAPQDAKRRTFVNSNVICLIALDQVLGLLLRRVVCIALEANVRGEFPDNHTPHTPDF